MYQWEIHLRDAGTGLLAFVDHLGHITGASNPANLAPRRFRSKAAAIDFWAATVSRKIPGQGSREWVARIAQAKA